MADCGFDTGRLVSEFPLIHWKRRVWAAVTTNPARTAMDEQKIQYHLQHTADDKLVYNGRNYNFHPTAPPWLDQAIREHTSKPFRAIIACTRLEGNGDVLPAPDFDKHEATAWRVNPSVPLARTPEAIAALTRLLCRGTRLVKILEPHLNPDLPRFQRPFRRLFESICQIGATSLRIEVHSGVLPKYECPDFAATIATTWCHLIPPGRRVSFFRWNEEPQGEKLHRRLILADRGGILVEVGLDDGPEGQTTTATRLSSAEHLRFWKGLQAPTPTGPCPDALYEFHDTCDATGAAAPAPNRPYRR
jgi:hypothetical protein